ncbi:MAG: serine kinase [Prolixibacteraceae bacterium]|nr:serine kinase [Prolixibacteraceae bacterium]
MKVIDLVQQLNLKVFTPGIELDRTVSGAYVSDLLSDVMGHAREDQVWITLQSHLNVVAIASLKDLSAVLLVKGIVPPDEVIRKAEAEGIVMLGTLEQTFDVSGKIYKMLV